MKRIATIILVSVIAAGCSEAQMRQINANIERQRQAEIRNQQEQEQRYLAGLHATCSAFGFRPNTPEHAKCVQQQHAQTVQQQAAAAAAWQQSWDERKRRSDAEYDAWMRGLNKPTVNCTTQAVGGTLQTNCR